MSKYYFLNGEIVKSEEAMLHVSDLSILRGYGIFDFFRTSAGKPLFMQDHLKRFKKSAISFQLDLDYDEKFLEKTIITLIGMNAFDESGIKLILTGGYSENGFNPGKPNLAILVDRLQLPSKSHYQEGVKLIAHMHVREFPSVKSTNYLTALILAKKCKAEGALDVLYHNGKYISELTRSNVFLVKNNRLITPVSGILEGITRSKILQIARKEMEVEERNVELSEVFEADELFITSSMKKVMPVVNVDGQSIGIGKPGNATKNLLQAFLEFEKAAVAGQ